MITKHKDNIFFRNLVEKGRLTMQFELLTKEFFHGNFGIYARLIQLNSLISN